MVGRGKGIAVGVNVIKGSGVFVGMVVGVLVGVGVNRGIIGVWLGVVWVETEIAVNTGAGVLKLGVIKAKIEGVPDGNGVIPGNILTADVTVSIFFELTNVWSIPNVDDSKEAVAVVQETTVEFILPSIELLPTIGSFPTTLTKVKNSKPVSRITVRVCPTPHPNAALTSEAESLKLDQMIINHFNIVNSSLFSSFWQ